MPRVIRVGLILIATFGMAAAGSAQFCMDPHWQELSPLQSPPLRGGLLRAMTYDSHRARSVIYGGFLEQPDGSYFIYGDTWEFDGYSWVQFTRTNSPGTRFGHALSYDSDRNVTVLFGGAGTDTSGQAAFRNDTWEWDGQNWTLISVVNPPTRHMDHAMVYDSIRKVHVLHGGREIIEKPGEPTIDRVTSDTWEYDGRARTWSLRAATGPSARKGFSLVYDPARQHTLLFGGVDANQSPILKTAWLNELWAWRGEVGIWERIYPLSFNAPSPRNLASVCFDPRRNVVVIRGGDAPDLFRDEFVIGHSYQTDTWEWNGVDWIEMTAVYGPSSPWVSKPMVYELARHQILLLSGDAVSGMNTWRATTGNGNPANYVNSAYQGFDEDGSPVAPFRMIRNALPCTAAAGTLIIRAGDYPEGTLTLAKQMRLTAELGPVRIH